MAKPIAPTPVLKGQVVGKVSYYVNDILYDETELYTLLASEKYDYFYCLKKVIANYLMTNEKQNGQVKILLKFDK